MSGSGENPLSGSFLVSFCCVLTWWMEKEMVTHSSILAWRIPRTGEPGGLWSVGSQSRTRLSTRHIVEGPRQLCKSLSCKSTNLNQEEH